MLVLYLHDYFVTVVSLPSDSAVLVHKQDTKIIFINKKFAKFVT